MLLLHHRDLSGYRGLQTFPSIEYQSSFIWVIYWCEYRPAS